MPQNNDLSSSVSSIYYDAVGPSRKPYVSDYRLAMPPPQGSMGKKLRFEQSYAQIVQGGASIKAIYDEPSPLPTENTPSGAAPAKTNDIMKSSAKLPTSCKGPDLAMPKSMKTFPRGVLLGAPRRSAGAAPPPPPPSAARAAAATFNARRPNRVPPMLLTTAFMAVTLGITAGGLSVAAMAGAGLLMVPSSTFMILAVAFLGLYLIRKAYGMARAIDASRHEM